MAELDNIINKTKSVCVYRNKKLLVEAHIVLQYTYLFIKNIVWYIMEINKIRSSDIFQMLLLYIVYLVFKHFLSYTAANF